MRVAIAVPIEAELVERIRSSGLELEVLWEPDLLPRARYPGNHQGADEFKRSPDQERRWQEMLHGAEILLGMPGDDARQLAALTQTSNRQAWVKLMRDGTPMQPRGSACPPLARVPQRRAA